MYKIGEFAKICNLSVKTLRFYADERLLVPRKIDIYTGYRYYDDANIDDVKKIIELKNMGFSLEEIRIQINSADKDSISRMLDKKHRELIAEKNDLEEKIKRISDFKENIIECEEKRDV